MTVWIPALLAAQLVLALWAAVRALPPGVAAPPVVSVAAGSQLLFLLRALPLLCLLAWPLAALRSRRAALAGVGGLWSLFLLLQAGLEQYYLVARVPLGADLFGYSTAEIRTTVAGAGGGIGAAGALAMLMPLVVLWAVLAWRGRRAAAARPAWLGGLLLAGLGAWLLPLAPGARGLGSEDARAVATSKGAYFVADSLRWWRVDAAPIATATASPARVAASPAGGDPAYPFLHDEATPDTLGPYFGPTRDGRPPNVVVIVVEGLGRSFSGPGAPLGSFTPFLDGLAARSLYFDNFLANQGRTFGVLPALLGSLPVAEQGFAALGPKMPAHAGLFNVLRRQGYHGAFYLGTDADFDNERGLLQLQEVDDIVDLRHFGPGYQRNPYSEWGYPDRELVSRVLADSGRLRPPFVLGLQTISMHTSYRFPGQEAYKAGVEARLQALGIPEARRAPYRAQADIYSAILYTDDQLRRYFEGVAKAPWYADTIFVVTGDHRLAEIPQDTHIERYHVPLLVFSPLLRRSAHIRAVSSHLDVTPSLLALLSHTYGLRRPARTSWTGAGLDMAETFRSAREFPLKQTKTSVPDFVSGRWFLHDGRLFELQDGIRASEVDDADVLAQVAGRLQAYQAANARFLRTLALSPEGGQPRLVAFGIGAANPAPAALAAIAALPAGIGMEAVHLERTEDGVHVAATFVNGDARESRAFVPLAVLAAEDGRELREGYGSAIQLRAHERREVLLSLAVPALAPGRYFVSVLPSDPVTGKAVGRGRFHLPLDVPAGAP
ncbi:LTA synthase family protein [Thermomonas sp.]|uniref:LTA synthase family protein n=1 Tax=Thermomonas sp. TaxID=1971895 RepID=UPI0035AEC86B